MAHCVCNRDDKGGDMATITTCDRCGVSCDDNHVIHTFHLWTTAGIVLERALGDNWRAEELHLCGSCRHKLIEVMYTWWQEKDDGNDSDV